MRSEFGQRLAIALIGESHGDCVAGEMRGFPAGIKIDMEKLSAFLERRKGGKSALTTPRAETDIPLFESGLVFSEDGREAVTNGETVSFKIMNENRRSGDYSKFWDTPRPSHADFTARARYGDGVDLRGGGHFSARLTAPLCVMGGICLQWLEARGVYIGSHLAAVGGVEDSRFDAVNCCKNDLASVICAEFPTIDASAGEKMKEEILRARAELDSVGGVVECAAVGVSAGFGDPLFYGIENRISQAIFCLGGVRGIEFGTGFAASKMRGSEHNDPFITDGKEIRTSTNHSGGVQGGITNGMPIVFRVAMKPTASIAQEQDTVSLSRMTAERLTVTGRHDPCIAIRALPCVEAVCAVALTDAFLSKEAEL